MPCTRVHKLARMSQCSGREILTSMRAARVQSRNLMMHSSMALSLVQEQHVGVRCLLWLQDSARRLKHFPFHDRYLRTTHDKRDHLPRSNTVLMPGSLLPFTATFRRVASTLPTGSVLILTPSPVLSKQRSTLVKVAAFLRSNGHHVRTLPFSQRGL